MLDYRIRSKKFICVAASMYLGIRERLFPPFQESTYCLRNIYIYIYL